MASPTYTYVTIYDEVKDAMNFNADDTDISASSVATTFLTQAIIDRLTFRRIVNNETQYTAELATDNIFVAYLAGYTYWLNPTFTGETDVDYTVNASGSIEVTSADDSPTPHPATVSSITVTAAGVNFALLMVDVFRYCGNYFSRQVAASYGPTSISPQTVRQELMRQASHWASEAFLNS